MGSQQMSYKSRQNKADKMMTAAMNTLIILLISCLSSATSYGEEESTPSISIIRASSTTNFTNTTPTKFPKFQLTRTALHVARSLDPDSTETVNVRTRTGDIATLIVRKRGGKSNLAAPFPISVSSSTVNVDDEQVGTFSQDEIAGNTRQDVINVVEAPKNLLQSSVHGQENNSNRPEEKSLRLPSPVNVKSSPMSIKGDQQQSKDFWNRSRSVMFIDSDGIPVIHGVRMPDDESDRQTWRNARVINGVLVPYAKSTPYDRSSDKQDITRKATVHLQESEAMKTYDEGANSFIPSQYTEYVPKKKHHYNLPYASDTHASIVDYINAVNQRETERRSRLQNRAHMIQFPASRRSDEKQNNNEGRELRAFESQSRVLQNSGSSIYPTSLLYTPPSHKTSQVSFEGVRTPVLQYAHPELGVQPARVASKQNEEEKEESGLQKSHANRASKGNALSLAYFAQDIHSDRSPYAYEPGVEENEEKTGVSGKETDTSDKRSSNNDLSTEKNSFQWPRKSFAYLHQQPSEDTYGLGNDKYIKRFPYNGYNNVHSGPSKSNFNRYKSMIGGSEYSRDPHGGLYTFHAYQERPFWERIGETIRDHVQTSMEKMNDITRPVVEPLVEATQKISHNLGFASDNNHHVIQDKIGSTITAYPVLLPALGLVAGGAALGLGAVAVGRYLDVDVMKRRVGETSDDLEAEHKRALEKIIQNLGKRNFPQEDGTWVIAEEFKDPDEQKEVLYGAARSLNERHEVGEEDTQRKAMEEIIQTLQNKYNNQQKREDMKVIENVFKSLNEKPDDNTDKETWEVGKNYSPSQDDKVQKTFGRQAVWSRADDTGVLNQDEQEKKIIETIVRTESDGEGLGHGESSWIKSEFYPENESQQGSRNSAKVIKKHVRNDREVEEKSSSGDEIIFVVAEEPKHQIGSRLPFPRIGMKKLYVRREDDLNQGIINGFSIGRIDRNLDTSNVEARVTRRFGEVEENVQDPTFREVNDHVISRRSTEYLDNVLYKIKPSHQEMLANMAILNANHINYWSDTPCAKKIFCDAMIRQKSDAVLLMEKKMATFLSLIQPNEAVSYHLIDVMEAVKRNDCSAFTCPRAVDASQVETPNSGPAPR